MSTLSLDLRYALRMLIKSPTFLCIAVLTLALGIGANTALFSVVNGVLLNPLPYPDSRQLVAVYGNAPGFDRAPVSYMNFLDWQRQNQVFSSMAMYRHEDYSLTGSGEAERVTGYMVTADFFRTLAVKLVLGRTFRPDDDLPGGAPVVVLGGGFWQRRFGSSQDVIGRTMTLNGVSYTVIGVTPGSFEFYGSVWDVYVPLGQWKDPSFRDRRISVSARVIARMKPAITERQARADMDSVAHNLAIAYPEADKDLGVTLFTMKEDIVGKVEPMLLVLLGAVGFLLLIACANVANLLFAPPRGRGSLPLGPLWEPAMDAFFARFSPKACCSPAWVEYSACFSPFWEQMPSSTPCPARFPARRKYLSTGAFFFLRRRSVFAREFSSG